MTPDEAAVWYWLATYLRLGGQLPTQAAGEPVPWRQVPRGPRSRREREVCERATTWGYTRERG